MTWPKQLSHYLFSFSFSFLSTRKSADAKQLKRDAWEFINRSKHRRCISSVPQLNGNSIEFSLSTQTRSSSKTSQSKSLYYTPQILPSSTLSSILALLELHPLGAYPSYHNIPVPFSIRSIPVFSLAVPFVD